MLCFSFRYSVKDMVLVSPTPTVVPNTKVDTVPLNLNSTLYKKYKVYYLDIYNMLCFSLSYRVWDMVLI